MRRTQPTTKKAEISSTTHVQMLQWLHGKQQQQPPYTGIYSEGVTSADIQGGRCLPGPGSKPESRVRP